MLIPLFHAFGDDPVLIFGGGSVGARRARLMTSGARVIVVSPEFHADDFGEAALIRAAPTAEDVADWIHRVDPVLVIAATNDAEINAAVEAAASRRAGASLVNRTDTGTGSVVVPAMVRDDPVVVGISTGGRMPALAGELRRRIATELEGAGALAAMASDFRDELRERDLPPETRQAVMRRVVTADRVWTAARQGDDAVRAAVRTVAEEVLIERNRGDHPG